MPEDSITFHQDGFLSDSFAAFEEMRAKGILCDLTVKVRNHSLKAHRVVLAAGIPYFKSLYETETAEEDISQGELDLKALESLIQFAYTGKADISFDNIYMLLRASSFLRLSLMFDACVEFLLDRIRDDNVVWIHNLSHEFDVTNLVESSYRYIRENFENISKRDEFFNLPSACVKEIVSADDLNTPGEEIVFETIAKWATISPSERYEALPELLSEVRMVYLQTDYLINRVASEEFVRKSKICMRLLEDVKNYHLLPRDRALLSKLKTRPRNSNCIRGGIYALFYCHTAGYTVHHCDFDNGRISQNMASKDRVHGAIFGIAAVKEKIYIFHEKTIRTFHIKTFDWQVLDQTRHGGMRGAAIAVYGSLIYCFGSFSSSYSSKVRCYDTRRNMWLKEGRMMTDRFNSAAASLGDDIYVTGGFWDYLVPSYMYLMGYSGGKAVEKYNPNTKRCTKITSMLVPRENHFCTGMNGKLYACGGGVHADALYSAEVYDPITYQWNFIQSMPSPRGSLSLVSYNDKIYAIEVDRGIVFFEIFDSESNRWNSSLPLRNESCLAGSLRVAVSFPATLS